MLAIQLPDWFALLRDFGGVLFSIASVLFVVGVAIHTFIMRRMPSHLHIALHFWREVNGKKLLKVPTMARMVLPHIYPIILATLVLFLSKRWARRSKFYPIMTIRPTISTWRIIRFLCRALPTADDLMDPLVRYLSELETVEWLDRSKDIVRGTRDQSPESQFVVGLVCGENSPSVRAVVIPIEVLMQFNPDGSDGIEIDPLYSRAVSRLTTLHQLRIAYDAWKVDPNSGLCIAMVEL